MNIKKIFLTGAFLYIMPELFAQAEVATGAFIANGPKFFICIIAGVLLAIGFQIFLSMLSVASGITAIGDIKKSANSQDKSSKSSSGTTSDTVKKVTTGMGMWTLITVSLSLFFASMLAVKLSLIGANFIGVTLGLVIWATFFMIMVYFEMKMVSSAIGGLVSTVRQGVGSIFHRSEESVGKSIAKTEAKEQAKAMRRELEKLFDNHEIDHKLDQYVKELKPQKLNMDHVRKEIKNLLTDLKIEETSEIEDGEVVKKMIIEEAKNTPSISREDVNKLSDAFNEAKNIMRKDTSSSEKARQAVTNFTSADREQVRQYENKVKNYLRATNKEALQPETIERDLNEIFEHPSQASRIIKEKATALDRDTLMRAVTSRSDISSQDAEKYVGYVEQAISKITGNGSSSTNGNTKQDLQAKIKRFISEISGKADYNLEQIKHEATALFRSASDDNEGLTYKLQHYNKEQLMKLVSSNTSIERDKYEPIVTSLVEARDTVVQKAETIKHKVEEKLEEAKQEALQQAENTREAATTAAWWMVATALVSGVAAALGGIVALGV